MTSAGYVRFDDLPGDTDDERLQVLIERSRVWEDCSSCGRRRTVAWFVQVGWLFWRCRVCGSGRVVG